MEDALQTVTTQLDYPKVEMDLPLGPVTVTPFSVTHDSSTFPILNWLNPEMTTASARIEIGVLQDQVETLQLRVRDLKFYLKQAARGCERKAHQVKAQQLELAAARARATDAEAKAQYAQGFLELFEPVMTFLADVVVARDAGRDVDSEFVLDQLSRMMDRVNARR